MVHPVRAPRESVTVELRPARRACALIPGRLLPESGRQRVDTLTVPADAEALAPPHPVMVVPRRECVGDLMQQRQSRLLLGASRREQTAQQDGLRGVLACPEHGPASRPAEGPAVQAVLGHQVMGQPNRIIDLHATTLP